MSEFQLSPPVNSKDFENLLVDLFNEMFNTLSFKHFGKNGHSQKGVDIFSAERGWVIQCKLKDQSRKSISVKRELLNDIHETISLILTEKPKLSFNVLYIATNFGEHPDFDEYCTTLKEEKNLPFEVIFWGWQTIQQKVISLPKTLSAHYSNFIIQPHVTNESRVSSRLQMKRRIERDFADWLSYKIENRKRNSKMIIHSVDDTHYPEHECNAEGEYQWFGAELKSQTHKGVEFIKAINEIYVNEDFLWTDQIPENYSDFQKVKVAWVRIVDYDDIVDYDLRGDEHYNRPHFYCKFRHKGTPFIDEYFLTLDHKEMPRSFDKSTKMH